MGRQRDRNLAVEFPRFRIDTPREYRWRARGLPPALFKYTLNLGLPRLDAVTGNREAASGRQPAWRELEIKASAFGADGSLIAGDTYRPGDSLANFGWPDDTVFKFSLASLQLERHKDYDLVLKVVTPSRKKGDSAEVRGWAPNFNPKR